MRIISGDFKGRPIKTTAGPGYRPATDKVRQALFSILEAKGVKWDNCNVVDFFAGSGSLGLEALSRGAPYVCFVEKAGRAVASLRSTVRELQIDSDRLGIFKADALSIIRRRPPVPFQVAFVDPPYGQGWIEAMLSQLPKSGWLDTEALVVAEVEAALDLDISRMSQFEPIDNRKYGQTRILIWTAKVRRSPYIPEHSIP